MAKLYQLVIKEKKSKWSAVVMKEIAISLGTSTVSFLTGGIAEAFPNPFDFAAGVSELVSEGTHLGEAYGANMYGNDPQNLNVGTISDAVSILRDLVERCKKGEGRIVTDSEGGRTCTCTDSEGNAATLEEKPLRPPSQDPYGGNPVHSLDLNSGPMFNGEGKPVGFVLPGTGVTTIQL